MELVYDGSYWVAIASDMRFITGAQSATVVIGTTKTQAFATSDATERMTLNVLIKQLDA